MIDRISDNTQAQLHAELQVNTRSMTNLKRMSCALDPENKQPSDSKLPSKRRKVCNAVLPPPYTRAECKPKYLFCDIPAEQSTGPGKTCVKTTDRSISQTQPLAPYNYFTSFSSNDLEVHTLPIGQGDCNIIYCPNSEDAVLFDCGSISGHNDPRLSPEFIKEMFLSKVKHLTIMLSHGDQDHYNYLPRIFPVRTSDSWSTKIQEIIIGGKRQDYSCINAKIIPWLNKVKELNIPIKEAVEQTTLNICNNDKIHFHIISANKGSSKNEKSIVMKLSRDSCDSSLLFTGDMEHIAARDLATTNPYKTQLQSTHYKVAHHGASSKANKEEWVAAIQPEEAHISSAYIGRYGHPRCDAVARIMNVRSIGFTNPIGSPSTHPFMCSIIESVGSKKNKTPITGDICHRFFSTTPESDKICLIRLTYNNGGPAVTNYYCGTMTEWDKNSTPLATTATPSDELCDFEEVDDY